MTMTQPVETILDAEQALRTILLDPSEVPETVYARGYLAGFLLGRVYDTTPTFTADQSAEFARMYQRNAVPMRLAQAVTVFFRRWEMDRIEATGWHQGFADATENNAEAQSCGACNRRLFADLNDIWRCERNSEAVCNGAPTYCSSSFCTGPEHRACHDDGAL